MSGHRSPSQGAPGQGRGWRPALPGLLDPRASNGVAGRWRWRAPEWWPLAAAAALAFVQVAGTFLAARGQPDRETPDVIGVTLLIAGPAALAAWRRRPPLALWTVMGVTLVYVLLGYAYGPMIFSPIVALYLAVGRGHRPAAWLAGGALLAVHFGVRIALHRDPPGIEEMLIVSAWLLVVLVVSEVLRIHREQSAEAERMRVEEERRRRSEERLHIATELHDVLAHHISLINVQAGVALHLMDRQPEQTRTALEAIEEASREAMGELRSVLNILQRPEDAPRAPAPSLARLDGIVTQAAAAGLNVHTEVGGERRALPVPVEAAAYRVVQEAITNVIRHASATSALIRLSYGERDLTVEVDDDGVGAGPDGWSPGRRGADGRPAGGKGLEGMRQRVQALGGRFEAGPLPGRGFRVHATLPLTTPPVATPPVEGAP